LLKEKGCRFLKHSVDQLNGLGDLAFAKKLRPKVLWDY